MSDGGDRGDRSAGPPAGRPQDIEDADPGLARARTDLAWTRSSISFAAIGLAIVKFRPLVGAPVLLFSAVVWAVGHVPREEAGTASRRVLIVTIAVVVLALGAVALTLLNHDDQGLRP